MKINPRETAEGSALSDGVAMQHQVEASLSKAWFGTVGALRE